MLKLFAICFNAWFFLKYKPFCLIDESYSVFLKKGKSKTAHQKGNVGKVDGPEPEN